MSFDLTQCTQAHVYDVDKTLRGLINKLSLEGRKTTTVEHKTLGMVGMLEAPGRPYQAMKGSIETNHLDRELDPKLANPTILHDWQLHKVQDVFDGDGYSEEKTHTVVFHIRFYVLETDGFDMELGEKSTATYNISIPYCRIFILETGDELWQLDVFEDDADAGGLPIWRQPRS